MSELGFYMPCMVRYIQLVVKVHTCARSVVSDSLLPHGL